MNTDKIYAEAVANEYSVKTSRRVIALQKLDKWVKRPAKVIASAVGVISFILNASSFVLLVNLSPLAHISCKLWWLVLYAIGLAGIAVSPLVYKKVFEYRKRENALDVIELAKEVINDSESR